MRLEPRLHLAEGRTLGSHGHAEHAVVLPAIDVRQIVGRIAERAVADLAKVCSSELAREGVGAADHCSRADELGEGEIFRPPLQRSALHDRLWSCLRLLAVGLKGELRVEALLGLLLKVLLVPFAAEVIAILDGLGHVASVGGDGPIPA